MEDRVVLSAVVLVPQSNLSLPYVATVSQGPSNVSPLVAPTADKPAVTGASAVAVGSKDAVSDVWDGYWLLHSKNVAKVGLNFAKLTVAHDTRKVGGAFVKAIFKGDVPRIKQLSQTNAAKKVGNAFSSLATSPGVKYVGDQFSHLGRSVADQFHNLFGGSSAPKYSGSGPVK